MGLAVLPTIGDQGQSPVLENGFRASHWAKMSSQDMQLNMISCIFLPKITLNSLRPYTCCVELYACVFLQTCMYAPDNAFT